MNKPLQSRSNYLAHPPSTSARRDLYVWPQPLLDAIQLTVHGIRHVGRSTVGALLKSAALVESLAYNRLCPSSPSATAWVGRTTGVQPPIIVLRGCPAQSCITAAASFDLVEGSLGWEPVTENIPCTQAVNQATLCSALRTRFCLRPTSHKPSCKLEATPAAASAASVRMVVPS